MVEEQVLLNRTGSTQRAVISVDLRSTGPESPVPERLRMSTAGADDRASPYAPILLGVVIGHDVMHEA